MRAFVSIHPPAALLEQLARLQKHLQHKIPDALRWTRAEQLHVTLLFLGDVDGARVPEITARLERIAAQHSAALWQLDTLGAFPSMNRPNTVWLGSRKESAELLKLQAAVKADIGAFAERDEGRAFHPHLTLARAKPNAGKGGLRRVTEELQRLQMPAMPPWPVDTIRLMQSQLSPKGAAHTVVAEFPLQT